MLSIERNTTIRVPLDVAFSYFAEFAHTAAWDPGVVSSRKLTDGPLEPGDRYDVVARFGGRKLPMAYEVLSVDAPKRVVLRGKSSTSSVVDDIRFEPVDGGTQITWRLDLTMRGPAKLAEPVLAPLLRRLARQAMEGIERAAWDGLPQQAARR